MRPSFNRTAGADVAQAQKDIAAMVAQLSEATGGALLFGKAIGTTETPIPHNLKRVPIGWRLFSPEADARVWQTKAPDATFLYLAASAPVVTGIEVF